ncbi:RNA polymerase sigma-70 factor (ECF subfamily) [Chryseobacterium ginsenosidimutans]|jgi:RNA polymerase sigma-70 factor (ECF subfamily)|uniref:RNA polymerase sigma factor n=1 Tax=Chryseobacterium ginsenosidimutans TaxID=687846 RepID=UPI00216A6556|nr:RNA polymerase sigma factor [Chryseobacterium ginsenosidimutans]MCS3867355.1 RNA polymerase sigma-70 factor (ECF subfamily) [Chryseobacterium ginsenosidimutans]
MKDNNKEQILVNRLLQKEEAAWKELFGAYSGSLTYVCSRYVIDRDDVHDVLQNSFIQMFRSIGSFEYRGSGSLKAWITRIVVNESLKHIKQNVDFKSVSEDFEIPDEQDDADPDFEEISQETIMTMIRSLPEGYRTVFNLYVFEKKSHKEIAETLGIAENSSASQFHRAKSMLAQKIKEYKKSKAAQYE